MKRIAFLFIIISVFTACTNAYNSDSLIANYSESESVLTTRSMTESTSLEQDITTMLELGLDTTNLLIREDYYIADGICVPKSVLKEARNLPNIGSRMTQNETINRHYHRVYYKLPFDDSHELYQATAAAVFRWGSISDSGLETDCGFHERYDNTFYQIEMLINNFYSQYDPLVFPIYNTYNAPYQTVVINTNNPL